MNWIWEFSGLSTPSERERGSSENIGGRGEIRTHDTVSRTPDFESGALNHSATLPHEADQARANLA
jgi:hypothetical protein